MESDESFEITFKSHPSSPNISGNPSVSSESPNHSSLPMASNPTPPVINDQFDIILSMLHDMKSKFDQDNSELKIKIQNMEKQNETLQKEFVEVKSLFHGKESNHHNLSNPICTPNTQTNRNGSNGPFNVPYGAGEGPQMMMTHDQPLEFFHPLNGNENCFPPAQSIHKSHMPVKLKDFDGTEDFNDFLAHFEILVTLHGWDYKTKSLYLASSLSGNARALLTELNDLQRADYRSLVDILNRRFGSLERAELFRAQLKNRVRGNAETISELAQSIKKLTRLTYPTTDQSMLNILSIDQFIDALPDPDMRLRLREARPRDINEAEIFAIRQETHRMADAQRSPSFQITYPNENNFQSLREELHAIKAIVLNNQNPNPCHLPQPQMQYQNQSPNSNLRYQHSESQRVVAPDSRFGLQQKQFPKPNDKKNWNYPRNSNMPMSSHSRPNRQENYPMSNSGVGSRQTQGAGPNNSQ